MYTCCQCWKIHPLYFAHCFEELWGECFCLNIKLTAHFLNQHALPSTRMSKKFGVVATTISDHAVLVFAGV